MSLNKTCFAPGRVAGGNDLVAQNDEPEPRTFREIDAEANEEARAVVRGDADAWAAVEREANRTQCLELARMPGGGFLHG